MLLICVRYAYSIHYYIYCGIEWPQKELFERQTWKNDGPFIYFIYPIIFNGLALKWFFFVHQSREEKAFRWKSSEREMVKRSAPIFFLFEYVMLKTTVLYQRHQIYAHKEWLILYSDSLCLNENFNILLVNRFRATDALCNFLFSHIISEKTSIFIVNRCSKNIKIDCCAFVPSKD